MAWTHRCSVPNLTMLCWQPTGMRNRALPLDNTKDSGDRDRDGVRDFGLKLIGNGLARKCLFIHKYTTNVDNSLSGEECMNGV